jgi:undecaprenyl-diphosphatase
MLLNIDLDILYFFNQTLSADWLDSVMIFLTNPRSWIPVYALAAIFLVWKYKWRGVRMVVAVALLIGITNTVTNAFIKDWIGRPRPCSVDAAGKPIVEWLRLPNGERGGCSLPSSHAVNNFATAMFFLIVFRKKSLGIILFIAAFIVSLTRIYLGLHYPSDMFAGAILGVALGYLLAKLYHIIEEKYFPAATKK